MSNRTGPTVTEAVEEFVLALRVTNKSPATIAVYRTAALQLAAHVDDKPVAAVTKRDIEGYLTSVLDRWTASTAVTRWGGVLAFFKWARAERIIRADPMAGIARPQKEERVVPVLSAEHLRAMLDSCTGIEFKDIRDAAIIRMLVTTGLRRSELTGIQAAEVDLLHQTVTVMGKGRRERTVHLEDTTALALRRYLRARARRIGEWTQAGKPYAATTALWIGKGGPLNDTGVDQMLRRRGRALGIPDVHAHRFRHTFAHRWLSKGGTEGGLMAAAGWRSRQMLGRYAASAASERSREEHARLAIGEGL